MKITVECENVREYVDLIEQLHEEGINYQATEQKRITEWLEPNEEWKKPVTVYDYRVVFWYDGRVL